MWQVHTTKTDPSPSTPSAAVQRAEAAIIDAEGWYHVDGVYYADLRDAAFWRRQAAERHVQNAERTAAWLLRTTGTRTGTAA